MSQIFRKSSIEKLSSPDQLDRAIIITSPMSWIGLIGLFIILISVMIWAFLGSMTTTYTAMGVISAGKNTNSLYSDVSGTISEIYVRPGDSVKSEGLIASVIDEAGDRYEISAGQDCVISRQEAFEGDSITQGDRLFVVSPAEKGNVVVCYVGIDEVQSLALGMKVNITPVSVDGQKYGHMKGEVINIDTYSTSEDSMRLVLGSDRGMREYFSAADVPLVAVTCSVTKDADSANGYYWTNEKGESLSVPPRTMVEVVYITSEIAPISKLFPGYGSEG
ncbi:MAG: HlyD family efflux transporter periplasmic adaptor subunit [Oscillospiraceae bacterium]|nr:HlyD family efflux transporter periplasmic adaptor subunit [Oscillospiraceae bacterium]